MLLRHSPTSPFVRKVMVLLHETGLIGGVRVESVDGWSEPAELIRENPLSMVPTLVLEDGRVLYDSPVICEYLDRQQPGAVMIPGGEARWRVLREQALADGILDCAVAVFIEVHKRPDGLRWDGWIELKQRAIERALDALEREADGLVLRVDLGTISIAVALAYLDFRGAVGDWRDDHPALSSWYAGFSSRPSMLATAPAA